MLVGELAVAVVEVVAVAVDMYAIDEAVDWLLCVKLGKLGRLEFEMEMEMGEMGETDDGRVVCLLGTEGGCERVLTGVAGVADVA